MMFYKGVDKNGKMFGFIDELSEYSDIELLDNSCVAIYEKNTAKIGTIEIEKQNSKGFISVRHIKDTVKKAELEIEILVSDIEERGYVRNLIEKYQTSIFQLRRAISAISAGRRIADEFDKELQLISYNQKSGTGSWFIFLDVDANKL